MIFKLLKDGEAKTSCCYEEYDKAKKEMVHCGKPCVCDVYGHGGLCRDHFLAVCGAKDSFRDSRGNELSLTGFSMRLPAETEVTQ